MSKLITTDLKTEPELLTETWSMAKKTSWLVVAKTIGFAISFALPLLLVRQLSQTEFGLYRQVFLIMNTAVTILPFGFPLSAFYFFQREPEKKGPAVFNILLYSVFISGLVSLALFLWPSLLSSIFNGPDLLQYAPLLSVAILLWVASGFLEVITVANGETGLTTIWIVVGQFSRSMLMVAAAVSFGSVRALIWAAIVHGFLQTAILLGYLSSRFPVFWRQFDAGLLRSQLTYVLPLGVAGLLYSTQMDLHNYFVSNKFSPAIYAVYSVGCFQLPFLGIINESVGWLLIPAVSRLRHRNKNREIMALIAKMMTRVAAIFFPIYIFLLVTGREFISLLFTTRYLESWPIFAVYLTLIPLGIIGSAYDPVVRAYPEHVHYVIKVRLALMVPLVAGLWFGMEHFGLVGAVTVMVGMNLVERFIIAFKAGSLLGVSWKEAVLLRDMGKVAVAAMIAGTTAYLTRQFMLEMEPFSILAGCGIAFGLVYLISIVFLGVLEDDLRLAIRKGIETLSLGRFFKKVDSFWYRKPGEENAD